MSRTGSRCRCASGPGRDAEIDRNAPAPFGFGRRRAIGGVAAARRSPPHCLRRVALPLTLRRSERRYRYCRSGALTYATVRRGRGPGDPNASSTPSRSAFGSSQQRTTSAQARLARTTSGGIYPFRQSSAQTSVASTTSARNPQRTRKCAGMRKTGPATAASGGPGQRTEPANPFSPGEIVSSSDLNWQRPEARPDANETGCGPPAPPAGVPRRTSRASAALHAPVFVRCMVRA